ncbi:MAG: tetraacyldisaccharide 4'-kinase [candidate division KSB1 bacterium]|nr:tetraacyldisaccharide 4'-kinase [candidate division KSB1 bacterium]
MQPQALAKFRWLLAPLLPLLWLFRFAVFARNFCYDHGFFKRVRLPAFVTSIGNLSVGGTGKTPATIFLATALRDEGWRVAIVSRGYRREGAAAVVVSDGRRILADAVTAGDEPLLMAQACGGVPVVVARDKTTAAMVAFEKFAPDIILVDDGFQHRRLQRDIDIVMVDARTPLSNLWWFPTWPMREPAAALRRAKFIILNTGGNDCEQTMKQCCRYTTAKIFSGALRGLGWRELTGASKMLPVEFVKDQPVLLVSGIAHPERFREAAEKFGARVVDEIIFADHHRYQENDLRAIESTRKVSGARYILTTSKDAGKLGLLSGAAAAPFLVLETAFEIEPAFLPALREAISVKAIKFNGLYHLNET